MIYFCAQKNRRELIVQQTALNGIDYLEVLVDPAGANVVTVTLDQAGDFSTYTFALVAGAGTTDPPAGIDSQLASIDFSFKAGCPTPADCQPATCGPPVLASAPDINYLAKDYNGFLQVMLDRLAVLMPAWTETPSLRA